MTPLIQRKNWLKTLFTWLVPPRCAFCRAPAESDAALICPGCRLKLEPVTEPWCPCCGEPFIHAVRPAGNPSAASHLCPRCLAKTPVFDEVRSAYLYKGPLKDSLNRLKFGGDLSALGLFEQLLAGTFAGQIQPGSLIVSIPPAPGKLRARGFDLPHRMAKRLAYVTGATVRTDLLESTGEGVEQAGLKFREREENARLRFRAGSGSLPEGAPVVLVDDVCTTAATLRICASILRKKGAGRITGVTLARTVSG